ncbi:hypothetical protein Q9L58_008707 [Maublancomyces gigas]|uniref:Protein kinase domain-containing protein n=1 Tax=Discina gigas TaxID=1032678 RepID=A0ABR3G901_9PEZI
MTRLSKIKNQIKGTLLIIRLINKWQSRFQILKVETEFRDGYVVQTTYEWEFSSQKLKESTTRREIREIGAGTVGSIGLEKEEPGYKLRAVRKLQRPSVAKTWFSQELVTLITHADVSVPGVFVYRRAKTSCTNTHNAFIAMEYIEYRDLSEHMNDRETAKTERLARL